MPVIEVDNLYKRYGDQVAVDDLSFTIEKGEIFGILGPNGAGKTTTVEIIEGLRTPDRGTVRVLRLDLYSSFYDQPADWERLLDELGLAGKRDTKFKHLSGGQKQRLSIALALVGNPEVAVLDELTTGLDLQARRDTWELIEQIRDRGVTVVLVTHFMEEAERLADRVAVIDAGRLVAIDSPAGLVATLDAEQRIRFRPTTPLDESLLADLPEVHSVSRRGSRRRAAAPGHPGRPWACGPPPRTPPGRPPPAPAAARPTGTPDPAGPPPAGRAPPRRCPATCLARMTWRDSMSAWKSGAGSGRAHRGSILRSSEHRTRT
jgi:ABC-2 type transport system ATP-binding protein